MSRNSVESQMTSAMSYGMFGCPTRMSVGLYTDKTCRSRVMSNHMQRIREEEEEGNAAEEKQAAPQPTCSDPTTVQPASPDTNTSQPARTSVTKGKSKEASLIKVCDEALITKGSHVRAISHVLRHHLYCES